jgi:hypothetical protein
VYAATVCVNINEASSIARVPITSTAGAVGVAGEQAASSATVTRMLKLKNLYFMVPLIFYNIGLFFCHNTTIKYNRHQSVDHKSLLKETLRIFTIFIFICITIERVILSFV